jgi:hypothetical protein
LPATIDENALTAVFEELLSVDGFDPLNIPEHEVLLVDGFAVYDSDDSNVGQLHYISAATTIAFLYSPSPFTITGTTTPNKKGETHELKITGGTGWNTLLIWRGDKKGLMSNGTPPADAKWQFVSSSR